MTIDFVASVEEVTAGLAALPGFDEWTAQYVALRGLGEPDAFPVADLPVKLDALAARAEGWRPWRGYATPWLWQTVDAAAAPTQDLDRIGDADLSRPEPARAP